MPILEVEVERKNRVGKFGLAYLDLYDVKKEKIKLQFTENTDPILQDEPLVCRPNLTKSENRPLFSVERGDLPTFNDCDVPEALQREVDIIKGNNRESADVDPYLTESESLFQDITKGPYLGERQGVPADKQIDGLGAVSGMSFSLFENSDETGRPLSFQPLRKPEIYWAFGLSQQKRTELWGCEASGGDVQPPSLISDSRNQYGINLAKLRQQRSYSWYYAYGNNRFYLEIRHGLNTLKYATNVQMTNADGGDMGFQQIQHKNSFILTKSTNNRTNTLWNRLWLGSAQRSGFDPNQVIPRGRITVTFLADPCDVSSYLGPDSEELFS